MPSFIDKLFAVSFRVRCATGLLVSLLPVGFALLFQHIDELVPCHLCIFQRVAYLCAAAVFALGLLLPAHKLWLRTAYSTIATLSAAAGVLFASRQIWLQHLPADRVPSCGASLDFMMEVLPLKEVMARVFAGTGECAVVDWTLLGLSMAQWSAVCLSLVLLTALWLAMPHRSIGV